MAKEHKKKKDAKPSAEDLRYKMYRIDAIVSLLKHAISWLVLLGLGICGYLSVEAIAGKATFNQIGVTFLANAGISKALAWAVAVVFGGYGLRQRKLRKDTVEHLAPRIKESELRLDSGRSSSHLTHRGDTNPEDLR
ncbi:MAG TPA: hypothetical protein VFJ16_21555 [Longimicrobium sp.]|nr:hypothetical protein [Longimicrobium sp.]